jgi:transposase InsO family protein
MAQVARNLTAEDDGFLRGKRFLILDGDKKFTAQFCAILEDAGVQIVRTAFQAPNMNAIAERWVKSVKTECLWLVLRLHQTLRAAPMETRA